MPTVDPKVFAKKGTRSPVRITEAIEAFCTRLVPDGTPTFVDVRAEAGNATSNCFPNVSRKVARDGGAIVYGWAIWEWPRVFVEAEHHAVWSDNGKLVDVTPHLPPTDRILFLPDPKRVYDWTGVHRFANVKVATGRSPSIQPWIDATERLTARALALGDAAFEGLERATTERMYAEARHHQAGIMFHLARTTGGNKPCFCQSGLKFKKCCAPLIDLGA